MKRLGKILLIILTILLLLPVGLWLLIREKPRWDDQTGHKVEEKLIEEDKYTLVENIKWAAPKGFNLTMDIYTPNTSQETYPVIVIFHGGGWLINDKSIMNDASKYLVSTGKYVVCNVNYRLLRDLGNTVKMNEIVEDVFGSILWIKAHIAKYKGDSEKIILTGDSAGGHLAGMAAIQGWDLSSKGFPDGFNPSWLPENKTAEDIALENGLSVQAAMLSYGPFDMYKAVKGDSASGSGFEASSNFFWYIGSSLPRGILGEDINVKDHPDYYKKISPVYNYPDTSERKLPPMLFTAAELDPLVPPEGVKDFVQKLKDAGHQEIEYWEYARESHAFLDSGEAFEMRAIPALELMVAFLDRIFYKNM